MIHIQLYVCLQLQGWQHCMERLSGHDTACSGNRQQRNSTFEFAQASRCCEAGPMICWPAACAAHVLFQRNWSVQRGAGCGCRQAISAHRLPSVNQCSQTARSDMMMPCRQLGPDALGAVHGMLPGLIAAVCPLHACSWSKAETRRPHTERRLMGS